MSVAFNELSERIADNEEIPIAGLEDATHVNFVNSNHLLFSLLRRLKYPITFNQFYCLRTLQSRMQHDNIMRRIFAHLGWEFVPSD